MDSVADRRNPGKLDMYNREAKSMSERRAEGVFLRLAAVLVDVETR